MKYLKHQFRKIQSDGDWSLYVSDPIYKSIYAGAGYTVVNTLTGDRVGTIKHLSVRIFDEQGSRLPIPELEPDTFEIRLIEEAANE